MKSKLNILLAALTFAGVSAYAAQTIIAVSPNLPDKQAKEDIYRAVLMVALQDAKPGDTVQVLDGWNIKPVATFTIPNHNAYARDPKARAKAMQAPIQAFNAWMAAETSANPSAQVPIGGARVPAVFEYCATHTDLAKTGGTLALICSTIYDDPAEPAFSMKDGYYPSDSHLDSVRAESVFGLKDDGKRFDGITVHWVNVGGTYLDDGHRAAVDRWWTLYVQKQGAVLASCDATPATVFDRMRKEVRTPIQNVAAISGDKLEMRHAPIRIRVNEAPPPPAVVPTTTPPPAPASEAVTPPVQPVPARQPSLHFMLREDVETQPLNATVVQGCRIGIRWPGNRDIDIYVRPAPGAKELFYGVNRSPQGIHIKDWQTSPDVDNNGFETVELAGAVDLRQLTIGINFYAGDSSPGGVDGTLRIEVNGKVFQSPFHVAATHGNRGGDRDGNARFRSQYWTTLDPLVVTRQR